MFGSIIMRYYYAIIWTLLLATFSYIDLVGNFFATNPLGFEAKIIEMLTSRFMILSNAGLVAMLFLDNHIMRRITKTTSQNRFVGVLIFSLIIIIVLAVFADEINKGNMQLPGCLHLYQLFLIFLICLTIYKSETLNIKRNSSSIINSKI